MIFKEWKFVRYKTSMHHIMYEWSFHQKINLILELIEMNLPTELMQKLGINKPIVLGPMMGAGTPEMVAAVTNSVGLGSFAASVLNGDGIRAVVTSIREKTQGPFNINLFVQETPHPTELELQKAFALLNPIRKELGLAEAAPPIRLNLLTISLVIVFLPNILNADASLNALDRVQNLAITEP